MSLERYEARKLDGDVFGVKTFKQMKDAKGQPVEILAGTHNTNVATVTKRLVGARMTLANAEALVKAISLAAKVAAKEAADALKKETQKTEES